MTDTFRVLVTGSRDWDDELAVNLALTDVAYQSHIDGRQALIVVHGSCKTGADAQASEWARWAESVDEARIRVREEPHPADWNAYGRAAGPRRNAEMVALGAGVCLAFIKDSSRGASHCARLAEKADIPTRRYEA